jgi:periplasmic divalent cation tolerance protein
MYRWNEALEDATEWLLLIKATADGFDALRERIVEMHPYEEPEIVAVPIVDGLPSYVEWIASSTRPAS